MLKMTETGDHESVETEPQSDTPTLYQQEKGELPDLPEGYEYGPGIRRGLPSEFLPMARFLTTFSRFARSLGFYNTENRALKVVFDKLWEQMGEVLQTYGDCQLQADASSFYFGEETVYEDADREHSIPFRLFRDGVRTIGFSTATTREELLTLAKILGMRTTGINRHGDDVVTRMWKADFKSVSYQEVRGFVPASAVVGTGGKAVATGESRGTVPEVMQRIHGEAAEAATGGRVVRSPATAMPEIPRWLEGVYPGVRDYELEFPGTAVEISFPDLPEGELQDFHTELEQEEKNVLTRLVDYLLDLSMAEEETFQPEQLFDLVVEGRRYLLSESAIDEMTDLVSFLVDVETSGEYAEVMEELAGQLLDGYCAPDVLEQILAATPLREEGPWQLREFLRTVRARVDTDKLMGLLRCNMPDVLRRVMLDTLVETIDSNVSWLSARLRDENEVDVTSAMDALASLDDSVARMELAKTIRHPSESIRLHLLQLYEYFPYEDATRRALISALNDSSRSVRIAALELVATRKDPKALDALKKLAANPDFLGWDRDRRDLLMTAIAQVGGSGVLPWIEEHIREPRIWRFLNAEQRAWNEAVVPALVVVGGDRSRELLCLFKDSGHASLRKAALKAYLEVDRRMREGGADPREDGR